MCRETPLNIRQSGLNGRKEAQTHIGVEPNVVQARSNSHKARCTATDSNSLLKLPFNSGTKIDNNPTDLNFLASRKVDVPLIIGPPMIDGSAKQNTRAPLLRNA